PEMPVESVSDPLPLPDSAKVQDTVAAFPPSSWMGPGADELLAAASPVADTVGAAGEGRLAVASPVLWITSVAAKLCPESTAAGAVKESIWSAAGICTVVAGVCAPAEEIGAPLFASVAEAWDENTSVP